MSDTSPVSNISQDQCLKKLVDRFMEDDFWGWYFRNYMDDHFRKIFDKSIKNPDEFYKEKFEQNHHSPNLPDFSRILFENDKKQSKKDASTILYKLFLSKNDKKSANVDKNVALFRLMIRAIELIRLEKNDHNSSDEVAKKMKYLLEHNRSRDIDAPLRSDRNRLRRNKRVPHDEYKVRLGSLLPQETSYEHLEQFCKKYLNEIVQ